jgi:hypothetical protein
MSIASATDFGDVVKLDSVASIQCDLCCPPLTEGLDVYFDTDTEGTKARVYARLNGRKWQSRSSEYLRINH